MTKQKIKCKPYNATFANPYTCISKQEELVSILKKMEEIKKRPKCGGTQGMKHSTAPVRYFALNGCHGCKTGLKIYKKYLTGEISIDVQTKKCPCGKMFSRKAKHNDLSWGRQIYCHKHSAMSSKQRSKVFKSQKIVAAGL